MYYIMVVDDEPISADAMTMFLQEEGDEDWEIITCYGPREALQNLNTHIDVLVTDIMMPEKNGFQLTEQVLARWRLAKIIFVTASNEIEYVQSALRLGDTVDYFLKTDDMHLLLEAIRRAIQKTVAQQKEMDEVETMRRQMFEALPLLRERFIDQLLHGAQEFPAALGDRFDSLQIPLSAEKKVLLLYGRFALKNADKNDPEIGYFKLENLIHKYTDDIFLHLSSMPDNGSGVWLFQMADEVRMEEKEGTEYLFSALDLVQQTYSCLGGSFSFILDDSFCTWEQLSVRYGIVTRKSSIGDEAAILGRYSEEAYSVEFANASIGRIGKLLESGDIQEIAALIRGLWDNPPYSANERLNLYNSLQNIFFSFLCRHEISDEYLARIPGVMPRVEGSQWKSTLEHFVALVQWIAEVSTEDEQKQYSRFLDQVKQKVDDDLGGDLSLTAMSGYMGMSPNYFSKLYKKASGIGYAEYIISRRLEEGARLLRQTDMSIIDITSRIGYFSASHFIRVFNKNYGMTPNEYRRQNIR